MSSRIHRFPPAAAPGTACTTCGDVAVAATVLRPAAPRSAVVRTDSGEERSVDVTLVRPLREGEQVLVHAGFAIAVIEPGW